MRLQERKIKDAVRNDKVKEKRVNVFLQSFFFVLEGNWEWEMESDAIFCSDVLFSPNEDFTGTKAIFHPDDVPAVKAMLSTQQEITHLRFRIITTYGEVKTISGDNLTVVEASVEDWRQKAMEIAADLFEQRAEHRHLQLLKEIDDRTSRFNNTGRWYYNASTHQTWYSDFVYGLHGLPAQGLNAHLHTFQQFVHPEDKMLVAGFTDKAFRERTPLHMDYRIVVIGREKWVSYKAQWFYTGKGDEILGGIFQDITEQKEAERETENYKNLVQSQRQQALYDEQQLNVGHWQINLLTRKTTFSDQYHRIFGLKHQAISPTFSAFLNFVHPEDREKVEAFYKQIINEHATPDLEYRILRSDGKQRHILQKAKLLMIGGELVVSGIAQDITVQRMLEKKVAEQGEMLRIRTLLEQQSDEQANLLTLVMKINEQQIVWSESFYNLMGYIKMQPTNASEKALFALVHPQDQKAFRNQWQLAVQEKQSSTFDVRFLVRGTVHFMKVTFGLYQQGGKAYFIGTLLNTTATQVLQQQLSQRVQLAESLSENTLDRVIITDPQNTILRWNRACEQFYGIRRAEAVGQNFFDVFPLRKTEEEMQLFGRVQRGEKVVLESRTLALGKGYHTLYLMPLYHEEVVSGILHIEHDVTREVELRNSLNDRLQLIEGLVQSSVDRIIALDRNLNYLYWNKSAETYYGLAKEKVLGKNILEVFPALVNDPSYSEIRKALRGETVHMPVNPDAEAFFETYLIPIKDERGMVVNLLWMAHDLSREWQLQKERLAALRYLKEQSHYLRRITETVPDMMSVMELPSRKLHYLNREIFVAHGFDPDVMQKKGKDERAAMIHEDDRRQLNQFYEQLSAALDEEVITAEYRAKDLSGEWKWFSVRGKVFQRDKDGRVTHILNAIENITARKVSEQEIIRLKDQVAQKATDKYLTLFNAMDEGFYLADVLFDEANQPVDLVFSEENPAAVRIMGQSFVGKAMRDINPGYEKHWFEVGGHVALTGESKRIELYSGPDNKWFSSYITKVGDTHSRQIAIVFQDVTERKEAEDNLKNFAVILGEQVAERTQALQESKAFTEQITKTTPDLVTIHDSTTDQVVFANHDDFWQEFHTPKEVYGIKEGKRAVAMIHPDHLQKAKTYLHERRLLKDDQVLEVEFKMKSGRWIRIRSKVFKRDSLGAAVQIISFTSDVSGAKQAEMELQKNLAILQQAEDLAQMGCWEYVIATGAFNWSEGMYQLFHLSQTAKISPETYLHLAVDEDRSAARRIVKNLAKNHQPFEETLRIKREDGERVLKVKGSVVTDENGKPQRLVGVDVDITDMQAAEERVKQSEHWLRQTALASPDAITVYDLQKKFPVYLNNCLAEWLGTSSEELVNLGINGRLELMHPDERLQILHFQEKLKTSTDTQVLTLEYRLRKKDDSYLWVRNRSKVFQRDTSGKVTHVLSVLQDVTDEKAAERLMKNMNASLEKKNQELEQKNEEITSFAFVASHDLKEPLRKIQTFSDWLLTRETALSTDGKQGLEKLNASVRRLDLLINDIVALTKVHAANQRIKAVDLNRLLQKVQEEMHATILESGAVVEVANLPTLSGDVNQLFFLFKNLVSNAIKFQPKIRQPLIRIWAAHDGAHLKISIADNGLGIAPEFHKKIFEVFRRLHSREDYEGTGMGLAICKKIMEKHGGKMTVESALGEGATFVCWFPQHLLPSS